MDIWVSNQSIRVDDSKHKEVRGGWYDKRKRQCGGKGMKGGYIQLL